MAKDTETESHLRLVHFTLLVTCLVLCMGTTLPSAHLYDIALHQIRTILEVRDQWGKEVTVSAIRGKAISDWMEKYPTWSGVTNPSVRVDYANLMDGIPNGENSALVSWTAGFLPGTGGFILGSGTNFILRPGGFDGGDNVTNDFELINDKIPRIQTLKDFQEIWDSMNRVKSYQLVSSIHTNVVIFRRELVPPFQTNGVQSFMVREVSTFPHPVIGKEYPHIGLATNVIRGSYYVKAARDLNWLTKEDLKELNSSFVLDCSVRVGWSGIEFLVPVSVSEIPVDPQSHFFRLSPHTETWFHGSFESSFRELNMVTKGRLRTDLTDLASDIAEQAESSKETIQLFSAQVPRAALKYWGLLVLGCIQTYFCIYFSWYLARYHKPPVGQEFPWIGFFASKLARTVFLASAVVFPVGTAIRVATYDFSPVFSWRSYAISLVLILPSIGLAWITFSEIRKLWDLLDAKPKVESTSSCV